MMLFHYFEVSHDYYFSQLNLRIFFEMCAFVIYKHIKRIQKNFVKLYLFCLKIMQIVNCEVVVMIDLL